MPTLNDPTRVPTSNYYLWIVMVTDKLKAVLEPIFEHDLAIQSVDTQPLIANQNVKITIIYRRDKPVDKSIENMLHLLCCYVYDKMLTRFHYRQTVEQINLDIVLEKQQDSQKGEVLLFNHRGEQPSLVYNDNTTTEEDELRFLFNVSYSPLHQKWFFNDQMKKRIEDYNKWFKNYSIDFATAKLISEAKQIVEHGK